MSKDKNADKRCVELYLPWRSDLFVFISKDDKQSIISMLKNNPGELLFVWVNRNVDGLYLTTLSLPLQLP